jgi:hypothetical protein
MGGGAAARTPQKAWGCDRNSRRKAERTGGARSETQKGLIPLPAGRVCLNKNRIADFGMMATLDGNLVLACSGVDRIAFVDLQ